MRKLQIYIDKYGPVAGPKLYHTLQSQAAHAGVQRPLAAEDSELDRGGDGEHPACEPGRCSEELPLFPEPVAEQA